MRRLVATGKPESIAACVVFAGELTLSASRQRALEGLVEALKGRQVDAPPEWKTVRLALAKENKEIQALANKLAINFRDADAIKKALAIAVDVARSLQERTDAIRDLALAKPEAALQPLLNIAKTDKADELRIEALRAVASFDNEAIAQQLLAGYDALPRNLKAEVVNVLASRKDTAKALLAAVGTKKVERTDLNDNTVLRIQALKDKDLDAQIEKVWGRLRATPAELTEVLNKTRGQLNETRASFARGKIAFETHCAKCHKFEGKGFEVGPNIEGAARDIEYLLVNVLDPNRVIGAPYFIRTITLDNGKNEIGILAAEDEQTITLKTENGVLKVIPKKNIDESRIQEKSLMPEGFGSNIKLQEFRDLIRYAMANPFMTEVTLSVKVKDHYEGFSPVIGVPGRIPLPSSTGGSYQISAKVIAPEKMKARLLIGSREAFELRTDDPSVIIKKEGAGVAAQPDQIAVDVELQPGENKISLYFDHKGDGDAVYLRFHDPDRKLRYPEPPETP